MKVITDPPTVLILAAGKADRWTGPIQKQLVDVGGLPLIARTIEQVKKIFYVSPYIITHDPAIANQGSWGLAPTDCGWIVETLLSTSSLWAKRVIVLLGDTYYMDCVLRGIRDDSRPIMFYGRLLEIYALTFNDHYAIKKALRTARLQTSICPGSDNITFGKLWHLWYILNGYPTSKHTMPAVDNPFFQQIHPEDNTMDIDCWDDYLTLVEKIGVELCY